MSSLPAAALSARPARWPCAAGMRVALVERDVLGSGATAAGMGHIVVMDDSEAQFALTRCSQQLWQALALHAAAQRRIRNAAAPLGRRR